MHEGNHDLRHALSLMKTALELLDRSNDAHDVGAHLDLAICRLSELVGDIELGNQNFRGNTAN